MVDVVQKYRRTFFGSRSWSKVLTAGALLLVLGGGMFVAWPQVSGAWRRHEGAMHNAALLQTAVSRAVQTPTMSLGEPVTVNLPRLGINLPVVNGIYHPSTGAWTIDSKHVFLMQGSAGLPAPATPIIYGHDIAGIFMSLSGVAPNELLRITNTAGRTLLFRYVDDTVVNPTDDSVLDTHYPNTVILMTCTGPTFAHRRALRFSYVGLSQTAFAPHSEQTA